MKKLLLFLVTLTLVLALGACKSASSDTNDYALKSDVELLEDDIQALQERIDNLVVVNGINGTVSVYENQKNIDTLNNALIVLSSDLTMLTKKDTFDKDKNAPDYIKDEVGGYVSFYELGRKLQSKYFNEVGVSQYDIYDMGSKAYLQFELTGQYEANDLFARIVLMIDEIRNYDFYVMSSNELEIYIMWENYRMSVNIPNTVILNSFFEITLDGIYSGDYEMELWTHNTGVTNSTAQTFYDDYVTNETYSGFVLNYIK